MNWRSFALVGFVALVQACGGSGTPTFGGTTGSNGGGAAGGGGHGGDIAGGGGAGGGGSCDEGATESCYGGDPATLDVGACVAGTRSCQDGAWTDCQGEVTPQSEQCNGADDDCNGAIDDAGVTSCGVGACGVVVDTCTGGKESDCTPLDPAPSETCGNGTDDDCDALVDQGCGCTDADTQACYTGPLATRGVGACKDGLQTCQNAAWGACEGEQLPQVEACDGVDNDCDGVTDEGCDCNDGDSQSCYTGPKGTLDVGLCLGGTQSCSAGKWGACEGEILPATETCDGWDNDCNGQVDDGNPGGGKTCDTGQPGECQSGLITCSGGALGCLPITPPAAETCDGLDNDCDGTVDDGNPGGGQSCNTGNPGVCGDGQTACVNGALLCQQVKSPAMETCDGLDNDCNGTVDEGDPGGGQSCKTGKPGLCADGTTVCQGGSVVCNQTVQPQNESCDGLDNDCDGFFDNGDPGGGVMCNTGLPGLCQSGTTKCLAGKVECTQQVQPKPEVCDGQDNDCNGLADDGDPGGGQACNTGKPGLCSAGTTKCSGGQIACNQKVQPSTETCDGKDNDCDGATDENNPGGGQSCATGKPGVCAPGTTQCQNGAIACQQTVQPGSELCDGQDNDCDGSIDENNPGGGNQCNTGQPGVCAQGTTACQNGAISCQADKSASSETCDGLDNDCDGSTDEGNPGGGQGCFTGKQGVCAAGTTACQNGGIVCNQQSQPGTEICDGLDNDCDGSVDENNPGGGGSCSTGKPGICSQGTLACSGGQLACVQTNQPVPEVCANNQDDDCNGQVDENVDADGDGWGTCDGDCCDGANFCSSNPALINPGALEVVGNNVDDDCDAGTSDVVPPSSCSSAADFTAVTATQVAQAMELCQFTTQNPPKAQKKWGVITAEQRFANGAVPNATQLSNIQNWQTAILANYGVNVPKKNGTMAGISTGRMRDQGDPGFVNPNGGTAFNHFGSPPPVYLAAHGGSLPASASCNGNCPAGNGANDSVNVRLTVRVPTNVLSFKYKFKFYSAEFPEWTCTTYNDFYLALLTSTAPGIPADTNISFDSKNNPFSVNNGFFDVCSPSGCYTCPDGPAELNGTGMQSNVGGGSKWLVTSAPVTPGETITLQLTVFDVSDAVWDTLVLLDDFSWDVNPAGIGTVVDN